MGPANLSIARPGTPECIVACLDAAAACTACSDACIVEDDLALARCIRLTQDCAALCRAVASLLASPGQYDEAMLRGLLNGCIYVCEACAAECERLVGSEHRRTALVACRTCIAACRAVGAA